MNQQPLPPTQRSSSTEQPSQEPIAIIGLGCRFPGPVGKPTTTPEAFWQLLRTGEEIVREIPATRWDADRYYDPNPGTPGKMYVRHGYFLEEIDQFDPQFFQIAPREASSMDPQQRLLLETSWEALEQAAIAPAQLAGSQTGIFISTFWDDYSAQQLYCNEAERIDRYATLSNLRAMGAGRLAHLLGVHGPNLQVDTACSASLTALHLACQSLRSRECDLAFAGGAYLLLTPEIMIGLCQMGALAADGRSRAFDRNATGFGLGEGGGMVLLKRLQDAQADGDPICALIRGSAINHDGHSRTVTTPNGQAQQALLRQALRQANLAPEQIQYVEAHGTGTELGDPIEVFAIADALCRERSQTQVAPLAIGSVKSNIGHLNAAAGIAGLFKLILALQHEELPPTLHVNQLNPRIPWQKLGITVPTVVTPWPAQGAPRIAGLSAFGLSGSNAHLIIEEAPRVAGKRRRPGDQENHAFPATSAGNAYARLFTLSGRSEEALQTYVRRYIDFLAEDPAIELGDLCYTTHVGRSHFGHRLSIACNDLAQLQQKLKDYLQGETVAGVGQGEVTAGPSRNSAGATSIAFLFTGQGSQYVGMGRELYETEPTFRATIERCDLILQESFGRSLIELLYPATVPSHNDLNESPPCNQAAIFALGCALADLWRAWGVQPSAVLGHSLGDFAAAYTAGTMSLEDGLRLVIERGRLMEQARGSMVAVLASEAEVAPLIDDRAEVSIAAVNGPKSVVISGSHRAVAQTAEVLQAAGFKTRKLGIPVAAHSPLLDPILDAFEAVVRKIKLSPPQSPVISSMTGKRVTEELTDPKYWRQHLRNTVRFADGVQTLHEQGIDIFLEIGPKPTLLGMAGEIAAKGRGGQDDKVTGGQDDKRNGSSGGGLLGAVTRSSGHLVIPSSGHPLMLPSLREGQSDWQQLLTSLGELYVHGVEIAWHSINQGDQPRKIRLPTYPFQRQRAWSEAAKPKRSKGSLRPLIDQMIKLPTQQQIVFETMLGLETLPFLADHRIDGTIVSPAACHVAMVLSAAELARQQPSAENAGYQLTDLIFPQALTIGETATRTVQILFTTRPDHERELRTDFQLISFDGTPVANSAPLATHATGQVRVRATGAPSLRSTLTALQTRCTEAVPLAQDRERGPMVEMSSIQLGPAFRWLTDAWSPPAISQGEGPYRREALVKLSRSAAIESLAGYLLHPGLLDGCFQAVGLTLPTAALLQERYLPFALASLQLYQAAGGDSWWCHVVQRDRMKWDICLFDDAGVCIAEIEDFELRAAPQSALAVTPLRSDWLYGLEWQASLPAKHIEVPSAHNAPDGWLIIGERGGLEEPLGQMLRRDGSAVWALTTETLEPNAAARRQLVRELATQHRTLGVVYLAPLTDQTREMTVPQQVEALCSDLLQMTQILLDSALTPRLWVVTQGCQVLREEGLRHLSQGQSGNGVAAASALWGFVRALANEQPQLHPVCIDLELGQNAAQQAALLHQEFLETLRTAQAESQIVWRGGRRYVARLAQWHPPAVLDKAEPRRLQLHDYGALEQLHFVPMTRRRPGAGEVELEVKAAGLNFRDLLNALGLLQAYYATALGITQAKEVGLGFECAGVVTAVGAGVTEFAVGERVMGLGSAEGTFAHYITLPADHMVATPSHLTDAEAATVPLAFLTAWYGLVELAQLQPGEQILIHAAAGGVGQAAVQIAMAMGAKVIATASPPKWPFLRQQGIDQILNSRTLDFAEQLLQLTDGGGVDVVFNSLNGDFIERSFAALGRGGRFVEIGKIGIWSHEQATQERPDVAYYPYDLGEVLVNEPPLLVRLWQAIHQKLSDGTFQPLPYSLFPAHEIETAFRVMQQAKQIGKLVIDFAQPKPVVLQPDGTYLITGGLGALGLQIARQLVEDGARFLVLSGRQGITSEEQRQRLANLAEAGAVVQVLPADIGDGEAVKALLEQCAALAPLRGIVHAAGVLDDGVVSEQSAERFATVMRPKVAGSWHLHTLTLGMELDFFVCFSSAASLLGTPGQSNYAAANAFMDSLMQQRRQAGLVGLSINWGAWSEIGLAAQRQAQGTLSAQALSMAMITPDQGRLLFRHLLQQPVAQIGVLPFKSEVATEEKSAKYTDMRDLLAKLSKAERERHLSHYLQSEIAAVMGLHSDTSIDPRSRLFEFGLDSLMAVELKNRLQAGLACPLRSTLLFDYPSLEVLIPYLLHEILQFEDEAMQAPAPGRPDATKLQEVQQLSREALLSLLNQEIKDLG